MRKARRNRKAGHADDLCGNTSFFLSKMIYWKGAAEKPGRITKKCKRTETAKVTVREAEEYYLATREKVNAFGLCWFLSSLDSETGTLPKAALDFRGRQLSVLSGMQYDMTTADAYREAVMTLAEAADTLPQALAHEIRKTAEAIEDLRRVPKEDYLAFTDLQNRAYPAYLEAKQKSDFSLFLPYLDGIFRYCRKYAAWVGRDGREGYDVYLHRYEPGYTTADYDRFFDLVREKIVPLVEIVEKNKEPLPAFAKMTYPKEGQKRFQEYLRGVMCFDPDRTVLLESEHPFTTNNGSHDVRITNHFYEDNLLSFIFSAIHEMGHGLYELQVDPALEGTGCGGGASLAVHESQSRLMENMIGRSAAFWETHFPALQAVFPKQLGDVSVTEFLRYVNRAECTPIRTEADELTYSLHVLIRYEIEKDVMAGKLEAADIPAVWNRKYRDYLGVTPKDDREGCLQDMHWAGGDVGYFPTYALGSAYAAQIYHAMARDLDIDVAIRDGSVKKVADWLRLHLHRYGASLSPKELILRATGEPFAPEYYIDYLTRKYGDGQLS